MKIWLLLLLPLAGMADPQGDVVFRSGVSLVRVDAEAVDAGGRVVAGLTKDDLRVLDEGVPQIPGNFSFDEEPLDLILLFDTSGGMHNRLLNMVRATELGFHELHSSDRVSVRAFAENSTEVLPFTGNLRTVNEAILIQVFTLKFRGKSRLEEAAAEAARRFLSEPDTRRKRAILIVTDKPGARGANEMSVVRDLWHADAVVSELIVDNTAQTKLLAAGGNAIVDETGGATIVAGNPGEAFQEAVHYLRSGYTLYYALPEAAPGSERRVRVELTPEAAGRLPDVRIRARSGYVVPGASRQAQ
ncbi:MAG TPA: VWA domain-containing protein [Bryobacteraceae bacterium]|nr:VWA domain-containing protein [Bryobacteraceae bacterium]